MHKNNSKLCIIKQQHKQNDDKEIDHCKRLRLGRKHVVRMTTNFHRTNKLTNSTSIGENYWHKQQDQKANPKFLLEDKIFFSRLKTEIIFCAEDRAKKKNSLLPGLKLGPGIPNTQNVQASSRNSDWMGGRSCQHFTQMKQDQLGNQRNISKNNSIL